MNNELPFRAWFYFRAGYSQYFGFAVALANMFTITYYLFIANTDSFVDLFPSFSAYVITSSMVGIPLLVILGFVHMKRSSAYKSEAGISHESHPYNYKLKPGIHTECLAPLYLELLKLGRKSLSDEELDKEELDSLEDLESKLALLSEGKSLDIPKRFDGL